MVQGSYNRRSSIEAKAGQLNNGVVGSVVNVSQKVTDVYVHHQRVNSTSAPEGQPGQQIRSKAQYDNWLQLQATKKGPTSGQTGNGSTGNVANVRQQAYSTVSSSKGK
jgi:hypothetical protein